MQTICIVCACLQRKCKNGEKPLWTLSLDVEKAFDQVELDEVEGSLADAGVDLGYIEAFAYIYIYIYIYIFL